MTNRETKGGTRWRPKVLVIGGPDVDSRIDLMARLAPDFELMAAGSDPRLEARFQEGGFPFFAYPLHRAVSPFSDLRSLFALFKICRRSRPDVVHTFATKPSVWGRLAARAAGVPAIVGTIPGLGSMHGSERGARAGVRAVYWRLQEVACRVSGLTVFQNGSDREELVGRGIVSSEKALLIPGSGVRTDLLRRSCVSVEAIRALRLEADAAEGDPVVTMIARVMRPKGVLEYAEAARRLARAHPRARFLLVGPEDQLSVDRLDPSELDEVRRHVRWLGERSDVATILAASDMFVLPSYYREGIPRVLLEASSMELPCVAARVPGSQDVVEDGKTGYLVPPRDVDGLVEAMARLLNDPGLRRRMGEEARRRAVSHFDAEIVAGLTADAYWSLLNREGPRRKAA